MSEAPDIGTIIEALEQYTRGDEHQRAIEAAIAVLRAVDYRDTPASQVTPEVLPMPSDTATCATSGAETA